MPEGLTIIISKLNFKKMKKIMFLLAFVATGLFASANNGEKKGGAKLISSAGKTHSKISPKKFSGLCLSFEFVTGTCPDGTSCLLAIDAYISDCDTGVQFIGGTVAAFTLEESC
jgi:hypothetical protein